MTLSRNTAAIGTHSDDPFWLKMAHAWATTTLKSLTPSYRWLKSLWTYGIALVLGLIALFAVPFLLVRVYGFPAEAVLVLTGPIATLFFLTAAAVNSLPRVKLTSPAKARWKPAVLQGSLMIASGIVGLGNRATRRLGTTAPFLDLEEAEQTQGPSRLLATRPIRFRGGRARVLDLVNGESHVPSD